LDAKLKTVQSSRKFALKKKRTATIATPKKEGKLGKGKIEQFSLTAILDALHLSAAWFLAVGVCRRLGGEMERGFADVLGCRVLDWNAPLFQ
jgi:hypothetical protein